MSDTKIEIVRPKVTLKIGDTKIEMEHNDLEFLLHKLAIHFNKYVYSHPWYHSGHYYGAGGLAGGFINSGGVTGGAGNSGTFSTSNSGLSNTTITIGDQNEPSKT